MTTRHAEENSLFMLSASSLLVEGKKPILTI